LKEDALSHNQMPSGATPPPLDEVDLECELEVSGGKPLVLPLAPTLQHSTQSPRQICVNTTLRGRDIMDCFVDIPTTNFMVRLWDIYHVLRLPGQLQVQFMYDTRGYFYAQVFEADSKDNVTGEDMTWYGRKWLLSPHMTDSEIVQTVFKAVMTAVEHEVREQFKYKGESVFDPHYDLEKLVELRRERAESRRHGQGQSRSS